MDSIALVYAVRRGAKLLVGEDPDRIALDRFDARSRHKLRIQAKKLRYAAEFFVSLVRAEAGGKATQAVP